MTIEHNVVEVRGMAILAKVRDAIVAGEDYENFFTKFTQVMDGVDDETQDRLTEALDGLSDATADEAIAAYAAVASRARTLQ